MSIWKTVTFFYLRALFETRSSMASSRVIGVSALIFVVALICTGCAIRKPRRVSYASIGGYKHVYISPTHPVNSTTAVSLFDLSIPVSRTANPRDLIAGAFAKRGYVLLPSLDSSLRGSTIVVNYGESGRRSVLLWDCAVEVTIQVVSADTGDLLCSVTAEGIGDTEAGAIRSAVGRAMSALFAQE